MQQKANKDTNKSETPAITETSETTTESNTDTTQTQTTASDSPSAPTTEVYTDNSTSAASQAAIDGDENSSKPTTNGPLEPAATQNGECKSPLEGKDLEESIPGLAQAKELAETLVAEDGSGIGTSKNTPKREARTAQGELLWWINNCMEKSSI